MRFGDRLKRLKAVKKFREDHNVKPVVLKTLPRRTSSVYKSETNAHPIYRDEGTI